MKAKCPICGRRRPHWSGVVQHARDVHKKALDVKPPPRQQRDDGEESYADRAIQADIDRQAGIYNPDQEWLLP